MMDDCGQTRELAEIILELSYMDFKPGGITQQLARELMSSESRAIGADHRSLLFRCERGVSALKGSDPLSRGQADHCGVCRER
jgi:hypothetical protein